MAEEALLSLALPSSSAERPSTSRRLTSLPSAAPLTRPWLSTASTISGSGLFHFEIGCSPTEAPQPTEARTCALENTSASGPMPTSRYCDQTPTSISAAFTLAASGDPAFRSRRLSPIIPVTRARIVSARAGFPAAFSSITRSIIDRAKVTPQALTACRSQGASRCMIERSPAASTEAAVMASSVDRRSPDVPARNAMGSSSSRRSRIVGTSFEVISKRSPPRRTTSAGPATSGRQTRPTKVPVSNAALSDVMPSLPIPCQAARYKPPDHGQGSKWKNNSACRE